MDFDFNLILVPATLIFFIIWLLDKLVFKQQTANTQAKADLERAEKKVSEQTALVAQLKQQYPASVHHTESELLKAAEGLEVAINQKQASEAAYSKKGVNLFIGWAYDFWPVLAVVLVVRSFLVEPFNIPSGSMLPTLQVGDFILVNKYSYGVRLPIVNTKVLDSGEPKRGEVAVFRYPDQPSINFIKRVIGLPGDHIVYDHGNLFINGELQVKKFSQNVIIPAEEVDQAGNPVTLYKDGKLYQSTIGEHRFSSQQIDNALTEQQAGFIKNPLNELYAEYRDNGQHWEVKVPQGHYFMMGDNRDQSADSRFWGFVPEQNLSGRAFYIWMHKEPGLHIPTFSRNAMIN